MEEMTVKEINPILVTAIDGDGKITDADKDIDKLYDYLYSNNLQDKIAGPTVALFYTEHGGKYMVTVPIKETIPETEEIKVIRLPKINCLSLMHSDPSESLDISFRKIKEYEKQNGIKWQFPIREIYYPDDNNPGKYTTEIQVPIN